MHADRETSYYEWQSHVRSQCVQHGNGLSQRTAAHPHRWSVDLRFEILKSYFGRRLIHPSITEFSHDSRCWTCGGNLRVASVRLSSSDKFEIGWKPVTTVQESNIRDDCHTRSHPWPHAHLTDLVNTHRVSVSLATESYRSFIQLLISVSCSYSSIQRNFC